jgi:hypothetical protein
VLSVLQARFPGEPIPEGVLSAVEKSEDARQLLDWLGKAAVTDSPTVFERGLTAPAG